LIGAADSEEAHSVAAGTSVVVSTVVAFMMVAFTEVAVVVTVNCRDCNFLFQG